MLLVYKIAILALRESLGFISSIILADNHIAFYRFAIVVCKDVIYAVHDFSFIFSANLP